MLSAIEIIKLIGAEFDNVGEDTLKGMVSICRPMVSKRRFGQLYEQALAYLVCHRLKMAGYGENPLGDMGKIGVGFAVGSVSEGGSSVSFGANQTSNLATDAELGLTKYGVQYLQIRRSVIIPIHVSGETIEPITEIDDDASLVPIATDKTLGGVRVRPGSGLVLHPDGTLEIDPASAEQVEDLYEKGGGTDG